MPSRSIPARPRGRRAPPSRAASAAPIWRALSSKRHALLDVAAQLAQAIRLAQTHGAPIPGCSGVQPVPAALSDAQLITWRVLEAAHHLQAYASGILSLADRAVRVEAECSAAPARPAEVSASAGAGAQSMETGGFWEFEDSASQGGSEACAG